VNKLSPDGCWLWTASVNEKGHGNFYDQRKTEAHRVSWKLAYGKIPHGAYILHRCGVRSCVNPAHLYLGYGSNNKKLAPADAEAIRASKELRRVLAARYGISKAFVTKIWGGRKWTNDWSHAR
jgi:hypothetical protein